MNARYAALFSLSFTVLQVCVLLSLAPSGSLSERWSQLAQWDSVWFESIAERGYVSDQPLSYQSPTKANVAFFPVFPLLGRSLASVTGLSVKSALLLLSQLACFLFWFYFFLLCARMELSWRAIATGGVVLFSYIGSYFLAVPYSEGLFLAGFLGMVYFTQKMSCSLRAYFWMASLHGFLMAGARFVGIFACIYPVLYGVLFLYKGRLLSWRAMAPYFGIAAFSLSAPVLFFLFCQLRFGHWDLYFITQKYGWGANFDFFLPYFPGEYLRKLPAWFSESGNYQGATFGRLAAAGFSALFLFCIFLEALLLRFQQEARDLGWELRWPLYLCGWMIFSVSLARAGAGEYYFGMYRYTLTALVPVLLALLELGSRWRKKIESRNKLFKSAVLFLVISFSSVSLYVQVGLARQFMNKIWME